jgi:hypothetical protein
MITANEARDISNYKAEIIKAIDGYITESADRGLFEVRIEEKELLIKYWKCSGPIYDYLCLLGFWVAASDGYLIIRWS